MLFTPHLITGATIGIVGSLVNYSKYKIALGAIISHGILDCIPHWDYPVKFSYLSIDLLIAATLFGILIYYTKSKLSTAGFGAFFGVLPDGENILVYIGMIEGYNLPVHKQLFHNNIGLPLGLITQTFVIITSFIVIYYFHVYKSKHPNPFLATTYHYN